MIRGDLPVPPRRRRSRCRSARGRVQRRRRGAPAHARDAVARSAPTFNARSSPALHAPPLPPPIDEWHVGINDCRSARCAAKKSRASSRPARSIPIRSRGAKASTTGCRFRNIPELAVLCVPGMSMHRRRCSHRRASPAQRTELAPIGGRAGALPAYAVEDWAQVRADQLIRNRSQVSMNPMMSHRRSSAAAACPRCSVMFPLAGGFRAVDDGVAIFGARWLQNGQQRRRRSRRPMRWPRCSAGCCTSAEAAPACSHRAPAQAISAVPEMVIGLDDPSLAGRCARHDASAHAAGFFDRQASGRRKS